MSKIILNQDQSLALTSLNETEDFFAFKGYAGTGKTTVITQWVEQMRKRPTALPKETLWSPPEIVLTAPTNKATNVLKDKANEINLPVDVSTIHSLLSLKLKWVEGEQVLVPDTRGDDKFSEYDWVVIDECSMLDEELMRYVCRAQASSKNKVVFMGDPCQLPPINEILSRSFNPPKQVELTTIMRQADGNPIMALSTYLRKLILSSNPHYPNQIFTFVDDKHILYNPLAKYEDSILESFLNPGDLDIRHVAWTNRVVDSWNNKIRDKIYGFDREEWVKGERIVTTAPVMDRGESRVLFSTDTLLTITHDPVLDEIHSVPVWKIRVKGKSIYVPTAHSSKAFADKKETLLREAKANRKRWFKFYEFMEAFAHVKPAHSLTVHRSQGSTFDDVYVSFENILTNPRRKESLQCLYVAITRPRSRLFLV